MDVRHDDPDLARVEADPDYTATLDAARVRAFRKVMNLIRSVPNEAQLPRHRGLVMKKMEGRRQHQYELRLNQQWRLIVEFIQREGQNNNLCVVKGIEDPH